MVTMFWVIDGHQGIVVVRAPFRFAEAGVASEDDPVGNGLDKRVMGCLASKASYIVEYDVIDHFLLLRY